MRCIWSPNAKVNVLPTNMSPVGLMFVEEEWVAVMLISIPVID